LPIISFNCIRSNVSLLQEGLQDLVRGVAIYISTDLFDNLNRKRYLLAWYWRVIHFKKFPALRRFVLPKRRLCLPLDCPP
jgi:hypothetical protein